jgi:hypothetical protein
VHDDLSTLEGVRGADEVTKEGGQVAWLRGRHRPDAPAVMGVAVAEDATAIGDQR